MAREGRPDREPPRQRGRGAEAAVEGGAAALSDPELLSVVFGDAKDHPALAQSLIETGGGLKALCQKDPHELCGHPGMTHKRAAQVAAALELGRRVLSAKEDRPLLRTPEEIFGFLHPQLSALPHEVFHVLCFNARNVLVANVRAAAGSVSQCPVDPKEVFRPALSARSGAVVLAHNHPSGDPTPSVSDLQLTRQLMRCAEMLCIKVLDHIVVGDQSFVSLAQRGDMERIAAELRGDKWLRGGG